MARSRRVLIWMSLIVGGAALVGLGVWFAVVRLDDADKWGSVTGALVALLGFPLTLYGLIGSRRPDRSAAAGQAVRGNQVGGSITMISGIDGNVYVNEPARKETDDSGRSS